MRAAFNLIFENKNSRHFKNDLVFITGQLKTNVFLVSKPLQHIFIG